MIKKHSKGFTLIELLVVVAIISLLSSVVLAALKESRSKAADSKIVNQLTGMRTSAELVNSSGSYGAATGEGNCGSTLSTAFSNDGFSNTANWPSIDGAVAAPTCISNAAANGDPVTAYSIWHPLNNSQGWCVDSVGNSVSMSSAPTTSVCSVSSGSSGSGQEFQVTFDTMMLASYNVQISEGSSYNYDPLISSGTSFSEGLHYFYAYIGGDKAVWSGCTGTSYMYNDSVAVCSINLTSDITLTLNPFIGE